MLAESIAAHPVDLAAPRGTTTSASPCIESLFSRQPIETIKSNATVFWEGDAARHVFHVMDGVLRVLKILSGGRRVVTGFAYPGDILGLSLRDPHFSTVEAVTPARIRRLGCFQFRAAMSGDPDLPAQLILLLSRDMANADERMVLLARKTAEERVCSFLLLMAGRTRHAGPNIDVPMSRLDVADYLGLTKETVCRTMARLVGLGLVTIPARNTIAICAFERLVAHAGDEDAGDTVPQSIEQPRARRMAYQAGFAMIARLSGRM